MKTCKLKGCNNKVKKDTFVYCSTKCTHKSRRKHKYILVENCKGCKNKMLESDKLFLNGNTGFSKWCRSCREVKFDDLLSERKERQREFVDRWNKIVLKTN